MTEQSTDVINLFGEDYKIEDLKPEVGKFYMFPSWLQHMVYPFEGPGERRTVAANLNVWRVLDDGTKH